MLDKLLLYFKRFDYQVPVYSLALFRILYASYTIGVIVQLYTHWHLFFDNIPPISYSLMPVKLILFLWLLASAGLLIGLKTRYAAIASYVITVFMAAFFTNANVSSFNDDLLRIGGFLLIVLPSSKVYAVDAFFNRLVYKEPSRTTSYLYYLLTIIASIGLLYFASAVSKLLSPMWQKGLGLWIPAVIPSYKWTTFDFGVEYPWLMYTLNYFVIVFELLFVFLLFNKRTHLYLAIIGIGFHLAIAFLFPFTYISFGPIIYYSLFIPNDFWLALKQKIRSKKTRTIEFNPNSSYGFYAMQVLTLFNLRSVYAFVPNADIRNIRANELEGWKAFIWASQQSVSGIPLSFCLRSVTIQNLFSFIADSWLPEQPLQTVKKDFSFAFKRFCFFVTIAALCLLQLLTLLYHSYTVFKAGKHNQAIYMKQRIATQDFSTKPSNLARTFFGINSRGVFLDHAFTGNKTVFTMVHLKKDGTSEWLPIFTKEGYVTGDNKNFGWHKLSFKYFGLTQYEPNTVGLQKYSWLWAHKNHISTHDLTFCVLRKIYPCATRYEHGYLSKMLALPWDTVGIITWKDSVFHYQNLQTDTSSIR